MLVYGDRTTSGTIGGGKFEALVVEDCLTSLREKKTTLKTYPLHEASAESFGAICWRRVDGFDRAAESKRRDLLDRRRTRGAARSQACRGMRDARDSRWKSGPSCSANFPSSPFASAARTPLIHQPTRVAADEALRGEPESRVDREALRRAACRPIGYIG
jgi:xanthine/CO dehydrogenase XdhC/CoxF family maturation factor